MPQLKPTKGQFKFATEYEISFLIFQIHDIHSYSAMQVLLYFIFKKFYAFVR